MTRCEAVQQPVPLRHPAPAIIVLLSSSDPARQSPACPETACHILEPFVINATSKYRALISRDITLDP